MAKRLAGSTPATPFTPTKSKSLNVGRTLSRWFITIPQELQDGWELFRFVKTEGGVMSVIQITMPSTTEPLANVSVETTVPVIRTNTGKDTLGASANADSQGLVIRG